MEYILLTDEFVKQYQGYKDGPNIFRAFVIERGEHKGKFVCNRSSRDEFIRIFKNEKLELIDLDDESFEIDYNNLDLVVDSKYPILKKEEDYVNKVVTITYIENGEPRKLIKKIDQVASKTGYNVDIEKEIQEKPVEVKEAEQPADEEKEVKSK